MPVSRNRRLKPILRPLFNEDGGIVGAEVVDRRGRKSYKCDRIKVAPGVYVPREPKFIPATGNPPNPTFVE